MMLVRHFAVGPLLRRQPLGRRNTAMTIHDEALSNKVRAALGMDKRISSLPIDVRVSGGDVFLKGAVDTMEQADVAQFISVGVPGVRSVNMDEVQIREAGR
jgi:osmotically-inducible protein OsmY